MNCLICRRPIPKAAGAGRPSSYCSTTCRREAEFTIRRLQRRLERMENLAAESRIEQATLRQYPLEREKARHTAIVVEISKLEGRLRSLLGRDSSEDAEEA